MLLMLLDKFIKQSEVFDIIYEDDCRDVISTITDLSNINAVSATLCASAERTGHTLAVLSVLRRLLLFPCLGTVSVSSTGKGGVGKPVDVGIQALCAVEESARLIFDVAKKADSVGSSGNRSGNRSGNNNSTALVQRLSIETIQSLLHEREFDVSAVQQQSVNTGQVEEYKQQLEKYRARVASHSTNMAELYEALNVSKASVKTCEGRVMEYWNEVQRLQTVIDTEGERRAAMEAEEQKAANPDGDNDYEELSKMRKELSKAKQQVIQLKKDVKVLKINKGSGNSFNSEKSGGGAGVARFTKGWGSFNSAPLTTGGARAARGSGRGPPVLPNSGARGAARGARGGAARGAARGGAARGARGGSARGARGGAARGARGGAARGRGARGGVRGGRGGRGGPRGMPRGGLQSMRPKKLNPKPKVPLKSLFWTTVAGNKLDGTIWDLKKKGQ